MAQSIRDGRARPRICVVCGLRKRVRLAGKAPIRVVRVAPDFPTRVSHARDVIAAVISVLNYRGLASSRRERHAGELAAGVGEAKRPAGRVGDAADSTVAIVGEA